MNNNDKKVELVEGFDEENKPTGDIVERYEAFGKGLWKRTVSCWILNEKGEILMQKRAPNKKRNPNKWSKTGGQVDVGETPKQAIIREVKEELGIDVDENQAKCTHIFKDVENKKFGYNYIFIVDYKINEYKLQKEEVSKVKYFKIEELEEQEEKNNTDFSFTKWNKENFWEEIETLKKYREKIVKSNFI